MSMSTETKVMVASRGKKTTVAAGAEAKRESKGLVAVTQILQELRKKSSKQLTEYAKAEFEVDLKVENGKTWLLKKVGYMVQDRYMGMTDKVKRTAEELDTPERITELRQQDENLRRICQLRLRRRMV